MTVASQVFVQAYQEINMHIYPMPLDSTPFLCWQYIVSCFFSQWEPCEGPEQATDSNIGDTPQEEVLPSFELANFSACFQMPL